MVNNEQRPWLCVYCGRPFQEPPVEERQCPRCDSVMVRQMTLEEREEAGRLASQELRLRGIDPQDPYAPEGLVEDIETLHGADPSAAYPDRQGIEERLKKMSREERWGMLVAVGPRAMINLIKGARDARA